MGACGSNLKNRDRRGKNNRIKDGIPISDTNYQRSTQQLPVDSELPAPSSHHQSSINRPRKGSAIHSQLAGANGVKPPLGEKQMSVSSLHTIERHEQFSRQSSNLTLPQMPTTTVTLQTAAPMTNPIPPLAPAPSSLSSTPAASTPLQQPISNNHLSPSLDAMSIESTVPSSHPSSSTPPLNLHASPHRGSLRSFANRQRSTSPLVGADDNPTHNPSTTSGGSSPSSPLRRELAARAVPPSLNLQSRTRFPRDIDATEVEVSPRHSARDKQTAAIRNRLGQASPHLAHHSISANSSTAAAPMFPTNMAFNENGIPPASAVLMSSDWTTAVERPNAIPDPSATVAKDSRRGAAVLNPRRLEGAGDSPTKPERMGLQELVDQDNAARFLAPTASRHASLTASRRATNNSVSQAIDLIDASPNVQTTDANANISRRSLRASRQSLNQLYALSAASMSAAHANSSAHAGSSNNPDSRRGLRGGRKMALLLDSNTLSQRLTLVTLHRAGYTCDTSASGEEALQLAKANRYELVLIDSSPLTGLTALETVKCIRFNEEEKGEVPTMIVNVTAVVDEVNIGLYKQAGVSATLQTGVLIEQLPAAIDALVRNPNYLYLSASLVRKQEARTAEQEAAEARALLARGERWRANAEKRQSHGASNRNSANANFFLHQPEGHTVRSNRRTTSTGRTFNGPPAGIVRNMSGTDYIHANNAAAELQQQQQAAQSVVSTPSVVPTPHDGTGVTSTLEQQRPPFVSTLPYPSSPVPHSPASIHARPFSSSRSSTSNSPSPQPSPQPHPVERERSSPNTLERERSFHNTLTPKPRRASLSIHSLKDNQSKTGQT